MMILRKTVLAMMALGASSLFAQRADLLLDGGWMFRFSHQVEKSSPAPVSLPHTWNAQDALSGKIDYKRGIGNYQRKLFVRPEWKGKRLFLRFEGANSVANVFVNGKHVGEHRGGYSAFVFEITDCVRYGADNQWWVRVNNGEQWEVLPGVRDFNFNGGLYRDVHLVVTEPACISLTDYASPGVYLRQTRVTPEQADVDAVVKLSNGGAAADLQVKVRVCDGDKTVTTAEQSVTLAAGQDGETLLPLTVRRPRLWNGTQDPFSYRAEVTLWADGKEIDRVEQPMGLRFYRIDPEQGFFLNGEHLPLRGVCRHQDRPEIGNALRLRHHEEDIRLMREMGVNAARLAHYQQAEDMYRLTDREGIVVWAEIPFVGPGGYADKGFVDLPAFRANGQQQLRELIRQNFNHPSICVWGLFNELKEEGDNPIPYIKELNELAHQEDTTRPTTAASNQGGDMNFITDLIAWNRYDGWYGSRPSTLATFLDKTHTAHPELCIAISEYGAGASVYHQQDSLKQPVPTNYWHPENWQTYYHIENWKILAERPFVWGTFVWNMFDFGAAHRHEGDRPGINDKGLVTFDRKQKKDAFYFYKANWNPEPMVHIAGKRLRQAFRDVQTIQVFTNCPKVELWVNGKSCGTVVPDKYAMAEWKEVRLAPGENHIVVRSVGNKKQIVQDETVLIVKVSESEFL